MAIDQNISVADKLREDDACETVVFPHEQLTEEKESEENEDVAHETAKPPTNAEIRKALEVSWRGVQHTLDFQETFR
jgi:DNA-directed RNA polymerase specialized sigma subunit